MQTTTILDSICVLMMGTNLPKEEAQILRAKGIIKIHEHHKLFPRK